MATKTMAKRTRSHTKKGPCVEAPCDACRDGERRSRAKTCSGCRTGGQDAHSWACSSGDQGAGDEPCPRCGHIDCWVAKRMRMVDCGCPTCRAATGPEKVEFVDFCDECRIETPRKPLVPFVVPCRLHRAAMDLLAALEAVVREVEASGAVLWTPTVKVELGEAIGAARGAIAKARGA